MVLRFSTGLLILAWAEHRGSARFQQPLTAYPGSPKSADLSLGVGRMIPPDCRRQETLGRHQALSTEVGHWGPSE